MATEKRRECTERNPPCKKFCACIANKSSYIITSKCNPCSVPCWIPFARRVTYAHHRLRYRPSILLNNAESPEYPDRVKLKGRFPSSMLCSLIACFAPFEIHRYFSLCVIRVLLFPSKSHLNIFRKHVSPSSNLIHIIP